MFRALIAIVIFLLLGAATSIALAWSIALLEPGAATTTRLEDHNSSYTLVDGFGRTRCTAIRGGALFYNSPPEEDLPPLAAQLDDELERSDVNMAGAAGFGWPWQVLQFRVQTDQSFRVPSPGRILSPAAPLFIDETSSGICPDPTWKLHGGLLGRNPLRSKGTLGWVDTRVLPLCIIWPNLMINAALFGGLWFALLHVGYPWRLYRALRRRRALRCMKCGYDRSASESECCPECGQTGADWPRVVYVRPLIAGGCLLVLLAASLGAFANVFAADPPYHRIHHAALDGNAELVTRELEKGVDPDIAITTCYELKGATPLHLAAIEGHVDVVNVLIDHGASLNEVTRATFAAHAGTPLHFAIREHHLPVVKALVEAGADIESDVGGVSVTPLMLAVMVEDGPIVKYLCDQGADVDLELRGGNALSFAVRSASDSRADIVHHLLDAGAVIDDQLLVTITTLRDADLNDVILQYLDRLDASAPPADVVRQILEGANERYRQAQ